MKITIPLRLNLISISFTVTIVLTLIAAGGYMVYKQERLNAITRAELAANELSKYAERLLSIGLNLEDFKGFDVQCADVIKRDSLLDASALFSSTGAMLYNSNGNHLSALEDTITSIVNVTTTGKSGEWCIIRPVRTSDTAISGYAVISIDKRVFIESVVRPVLLLGVISFIFSIVTGTLQQFLFQKTISRPLNNLVQTADNLHSADPERVQLLKDLSNDDDVGRIYASLHRLMTRLIEVQNSLVEHNRELDETVKKRTVQLEQANQLLAQDIERRKELEEELRTMADTDFLTGLPNRSSLDSRLKKVLVKATRDGLLVAVFFIDLDNFKVINDTLGHQVGDKLLIGVAQRLLNVCRRSDIVARLGGDEFIVILPDLTSSRHAGVIANKIIVSLKEPFLIEDKLLHIGTSIGISISPDDSLEAKVLMQDADTAMYQAKNSGRNNFQYFNESMHQHVQKRHSIETELRTALINNEFVLHYQPILETSTLKVIGVEALIRWRTSNGTLIYPDKFIGIAEEIGLIIPMGSWVIYEACKQLVAWDRDGLEIGRVAVNLSARQLGSPELLGTVTSALERTGIAPFRLELEITESTLMKTDEAVNVLREFKEMGIRLSIDDFGTGYSSFSYLKLLPVHYLKIDRSFISNIASHQNDEKITATIITLAHGLELGVVAEGVETKEQLALLQKHNCNLLQGYLFSRPLDAVKITELMHKLKDNSYRFTV